MAPSPLPALRTRCNQPPPLPNPLLSFNGPLSQCLIESFGGILREHLRAQAPQAQAADVFSVYVEMTQNICHYVCEHGLREAQAHASLSIGRDAQGRYVICGGNLVEAADGRRLLDTLAGIARLDRAQLKAAYKARLYQVRDPQASHGAGLGLLDIAGKVSAPLQASLSPQPEGRAFFSLCSTI